MKVEILSSYNLPFISFIVPEAQPNIISEVEVKLSEVENFPKVSTLGMSEEIAAAVQSGFEEVIEKELIIKEDNFKMSEAAPPQSEITLEVSSSQPAELPELEVEVPVEVEKTLYGQQDEKKEEEEETLVETQLQEEPAPIEGTFF